MMSSEPKLDEKTAPATGVTMPDAEFAAAAGRVILVTAQLESRLRQIAGSSEITGLHNLTEALGDKLPESLQKSLHYLATVRNQLAHESALTPETLDIQRFLEVSQTVAQELNRIFPESSASNSERTAPPESPKVEKSSSKPEARAPRAKEVVADSPQEVLPEEESKYAVEREFFERLNRRFVLLGYIPIIGAVNLLRLLLGELLREGYLLLSILFYFSSIVLAVGYWKEPTDNQTLFHIAIGAFLLSYAASVLFRLLPNGKIRIPGFFAFTPVAHIFYLSALWALRISWLRIALPLIGFATLWGAWFFFTQNNYPAMWWMLAAESLISAAGSFFFKGRR